MLSAIVLYGLLSLASVVVSLPSGPSSHIARRREWSHSSQPNNRLEKDTSLFATQYSSNWAGAIWEASDGTFTHVTGTFTVPTPSGSVGDSAAAWVGIDGEQCNTILQTGVDLTVGSSQPEYTAWFEWYPNPTYEFLDYTISSGNVIKLTVNASSSTSGTVTVDNLTTGQSVSTTVGSPATPLCGQSAEWVVEDYATDSAGDLVPLANFGTVTFTDAEATGPGSETYTPGSGATIDEMVDSNGQIVTSVSTSGSSVTIKYV